MKKIPTLIALLLLTLTFATQVWAQGGKQIIKNPDPAAVIDVSKTYIIVSSSSGLALDVAGGSKENMAAINQYERHNGVNQQWRFQAAGGGFYYIASVGSGKVLDIRGLSMAPGGVLVQLSKNQQANQKFKLVNKGGAYQILASHSGMALEVPGAVTTKVQIVQNASTDNANQLWRLVPYTAPTPAPAVAPAPAPAPTPQAVSWIDGAIFLKGPSTNMGITVYYQQIANNTPIILHEGINQWVMLPNGAIVLKDNPKFGLTVENQNLSNGSRIILHEGYNLWKVLSDGAIVLKDKPSLGITVLNQNHVNEAQIILHEGYNTWRK